jgi:hypothetical protein
MRYRLRTLLILLAVGPPVLWWIATEPAVLVVMTACFSPLILVAALMLAFLWKNRNGFIEPDDSPE